MEGVFVILDNARAHTGKQMDDYIESTKGDVALVVSAPSTPQHNPKEVQWREIRRAVADIFFAGLDICKTRIWQLLHSGEVPMQSLIMQGPLKVENGPWHHSADHTYIPCNHYMILWHIQNTRTLNIHSVLLLSCNLIYNTSEIPSTPRALFKLFFIYGLIILFLNMQLKFQRRK